MKKFMLICAPMTSRSGYGAHARDLIKSFMEHDKYDIQVFDVPWGSTPRNALDKNNVDDKKMLDLITRENSFQTQPDIYVDIRIPNEFQNPGKFNIGITAGIETNAVSQAWIEGCNKMDLVIVPSKHSKDGFVNALYEKIQQLPDGQQKKIGELKLEKPIEILFEGSDKIYRKLSTEEIDSKFFDWLNDEVPEKFAFLHVGLWGKGGYGEDRKDIGTLLKTFYESFANKKKQPALILKTSGANFSIIDRNDIKKKINDIKGTFGKTKLPNLYLLHGDLTDEEMNEMYNHPKVKAHVSFTHGEGFGRPLLEASFSGKPIIAPISTGQADFLDKDYTIEIPHKLTKVPPNSFPKGYTNPESQWSTVNYGIASRLMSDVFQNYDKYKVRGKKQMIVNRENFSFEAMKEKLVGMVDEILGDVPKQVELKLPTLKKEPKKLKLPKLKKG